MSIVDPTTGDVRPAGEYGRSDWQKIVRNNPEAASLLLQLRRKEKEVAELRQQNRQDIPIAIGGLAAGAAFPFAYEYAPQAGEQFADRWQRWGYANYNLDKPDVIYDGARVRLSVDPVTQDIAPGQLNLRVDGNLQRQYNYEFRPEDLLNAKGKPLTGSAIDARQRVLIRDGKYIKKTPQPVTGRQGIYDELKEAAKAIAARSITPEGRKVYFAAAGEDGLLNRKRAGLIGLQPTTLAGTSAYVKDNRLGANWFGEGYHLIDDAIARAGVARAGGPSMKGLRFAGALAAALGLGTLTGTAVNWLDGE